MRNESKIIANLYEEILRGDYLSEDSNVDDFNWDGFFRDKYTGIYSTVLVESYEKVKDLEPSAVGLFDQYNLILNNGLDFTLNINYNDCKQVTKLRGRAIADAEIKRRRDIVDGWEHFSNIQPDEYVALVEFQDSKGRHDATGEVGASSKELFSMLTLAVSDSLANQRMFDKTIGIMMLVDNKEPKRLVLYKKILERSLRQTYPIVFVDDNTNSGNNVSILIAAKG